MGGYHDRGLDRKDDAEIRERARRIIEARLSLNLGKQRKALTQDQLNAALGDEEGMGHQSRADRARQRRKRG